MINRPHEFAATRRVINEGISLTPEQAANCTLDLRKLPSPRSRLQFDEPWQTPAEKGLVKNWGHA